MTGVITWDGVSSDQFGVGIEKYPSRQKPSRKMNVYSVPGRNGDIILMQDAWDNVEQQYDLIVGDGDEHSATELFSQLSGWLCSPNGYCELWDDFDPLHYRLAYLKDPFGLENIGLGEAGRTTITFVCKPQRFLLSGKEIIRVTEQTTITNPTKYASKPLIHMYSTSVSGVKTITIGETIFTLDQRISGEMYIDCDEMNCYNWAGESLNVRVSSNTSEFAKLEPGSNVISFTGTITALDITPRWFDI